MPSDYDHGESLNCPSCGAGYVASAEVPHITTEDDARCPGCADVMTHWPQAIGFVLIESADEAGRRANLSPSRILPQRR